MKDYSPAIRVASHQEKGAGLFCGRCSHVQKVPNEEQGIEYHRCMIRKFEAVSDLHTCDAFESQFGEEHE